MRSILLILLLAFPFPLFAGQGMYPVPMVYQSSTPAGHNTGLDSDVNLVARYLFESQDGTDTEGGTSLTANGTPSYESGSPLEGSYSASTDGTDDNYSLSYDSAPSNFLGFGTTTGSFFFRFKIKSDCTLDQERFIGNVEEGASYREPWRVMVYGQSAGDCRIQLQIEDEGGVANRVTLTHGSDLAINTEYCVAITYDNTADDAYIHVYDNSGSEVGSAASDLAFTAGLGMLTTNVGSGDTFRLASGEYAGSAEAFADVIIDEVLLFSDILSASEVSDLAGGTY